VIVAGSKEVVAKALRQADKYREELLKRGVLLVPLVWTGTNEAPLKKKGFGGLQKPATTPIPIGDEFETRAQEVASKGVVQSERRFKAEPVSPLEWQRSAMSSLPFSKCHALSLRNTEIGFIQNLKDVACNPCENPLPS
jgi:hypothetical protein